MRLRGVHIVLAVVLALIVSCRGPKLISKSEMKEIYSDMFLLDQQLKDDRALKRHADTMLVYEGVLEAYGYNTDDYLYSVAHYLKDPERFAKMLKQVSEELERRAKQIDREIKAKERRDKYMKVKGFPVDSMLLPFCRDSIWAGAVHFEKDSVMQYFLRLVPLLKDTTVVDSLSINADSLSIVTDSLSVVADSLKNEADSSKIPLPSDEPGADSLGLR